MAPPVSMAHRRGMDEQTVTVDRERTDDAPPFPPPVPPPTGPRWYEQPVARDPHEQTLGGVIAGLSRTFGFDVRTTRIAVAIATLVLPVLALVYIAAWVLLPATPDEAASLEAIVRDRRRVPLYIAIGLVLVFGGIGSFGSWFLFGGFPWGVGLIAVGVLLWLAPSLGRSTPPAPPAPFAPPNPPAPPISSTSSTSFAAPADTTVLPATGTVFTPRPLQLDDVRPRRRRWPIGSMVTLAVMAFIGIASAGDALGWWDIPVLTVVLVSLVTTIVGVIVSGIVNRSWMGVPLVAILGVATTGLLIAQPDLDGGMGDRSVTPETIAEGERPQQLGLGELNIDLTVVPLGTVTQAAPLDVRAEVGIGRLRVTVPDDVTVVLDATVGAGELVIDGRNVTDGVRHHEQTTLTPATGTPSTATVVLDIEMGIGRIDIDRVS